MNSELESRRKPIQKPDLRRRLKLSFWLLLWLAAIISYRVFIVRWPTEGLSWNGLTVGQSTIRDVRATLGEPSKISFGLMSGTVYHYENRIGESLARPTIYFRCNRVIRIRVINEEAESLFTFVDQYGKPDLITKELTTGVRTQLYSKGIYWLDEGIYLSILSPDSATFFITYFRPCPTFDGFCIWAEQWNYNGLAVAIDDPWGIMTPLPTPTLTPTPGRVIFIPD